MTKQQKQIVKAALERGYFKIPRETTLTELADEFDKTDVQVAKELNTVVEKSLQELTVEN